MQAAQAHGFVGRRILHLAIGLVFTTGLLFGLVRDSYGGGCTPSEEETKWSKYKACSDQHENDRTTCNGLLEDDKGRRARCWASANERLAKCNNSKGKTLNEPEIVTH